MSNKLKSFLLLIVVIFMALPLAGHAAEKRTVKQLQFGKQVIDVGEDDVITFYGVNGRTQINGRYWNSHSLTVFKPASGKSIEIVFSEVSMENVAPPAPDDDDDDDLYGAPATPTFTYLNIYAGDPDANNSFKWATKKEEVTATTVLPAGKILGKLEGKQSNVSFLSEKADDPISVGFIYFDASATRWTATVRCVDNVKMTVAEAFAAHDNVVATPAINKGIPFANVSITTQGMSNPDVLTGVEFKVPVNASAIDATKLKLYAGKAADYSALAPLTATVVPAGADSYKFTLNHVLSEGENLFTIAGEFLESAPVGAQAQVVITGITTQDLPNGYTNFRQAISPVTVAKPAIALISTTPQEITVGDVPVNFYDDGGKDGKISKDFEGSITFVPATQGKSIAIDFKKLKLFISSLGVNDEKSDLLKFYNGRKVDESKLITRLTKELETVKSTATDGSMTVYMRSKTGYPAEGWEAVVSQFKPEAMSFTELLATEAGKATVAAESKNVQMLFFNVKTKDTENALKLTNVKLTTADAKNMANATVYYLGKKKEFSTKKKVATTAVSGNEITITGEQELIEGNNFFAVVLDLNDKALNGENIELSFAGATVGGELRNPTKALKVARTIKNECYATKGKQSHLLRDSWDFYSEPSSLSYSKNYNTGTEDCIVTFTPAEKDHKAMIAFDSFDVQYASANYGTKAKFAVYSGTIANKENLLWEIDAQHAKTGPGKQLRSKAADGSLTIVFNPKTDRDYYTRPGWKAVVYPFKNTAMEIAKTHVKQTSTADLSTGATNEPLIDLEVVTKGSLTTKVLKEVKLNLKGHEAIDKVKVMYSGAAYNLTNAVEFGSTTEIKGEEVTIAGNAELVEGSNYFWVQVDVKADAQAGTAVDARVISITDADNKATAVTEDPKGERVVKNVLLMKPEVMTVTVTNPIKFYDDGGPDKNFSKNFKGTVIFKSGKPGHAVKLNSNSFVVVRNYFYVYNGSAVDKSQLIGKYSYSTGPKDIISSAPDGSLTVRFETTTASAKGFEIDVRLHELTPIKVESVTAAAVSATPVMRGESNAQLQKVTMQVTGDMKSTKVTDLKFSLAGTTQAGAVKAARLFYTDIHNGFATTHMVGEVVNPQGEIVFTAAQPIEINAKGNYYFWLTADVDATATAGGKIVANLIDVKVDGASLAPQATAATREIKAGVKGNFVIGASSKAHFKTFGEAVASLKVGVEGPVTFEVEDGTYAQNIKLDAIKGAGVNSPITFKGQSGDRTKVIITGERYNKPSYGSGKKEYGMVNIDSTCYVTFKHMTFAPKDQTYPAAIRYFNRSQHGTLDDVAVKADQSTDIYGMSLVQTKSYDLLSSTGSGKNVYLDGNNNDFFTVQNSEFTGGRIALYLGGTGYISLTREQGLKVLNNTISGAGSKGIYVSSEDDALIEGNTVTVNSVSKSGYWGLDLNRVRGKTIVRNNTVVNSQELYSYGMEIRDNSYGSDNEPVLVYNNAISVSNTDTGSKGIAINSDCKNISFIYNTVRMGGKDATTINCGNRGDVLFTGIVFQNNLLQNLSGAKNNMFFHRALAEKLKTVAFNNNAFTDGNIVDGKNIQAFATMVGNTTNIVEAADFVSDADLHLKSAGKLNAGAPVASITSDADGKPRDAAKPTIGAYEYKDIVIEAPAIAEGYPVVAKVAETTADVKTKWNVAGKLYAMVEKVENVTPAPQHIMNVRAPRVVTADDLLATTPVNYAAGTEAVSNFSKLTPGTQYKAYFLLESALDGSKSEVVASEVFTTDMKYDSLTITMARPYATIQAGKSATITPVVAGGKAPYTYEWRDQMNQVLGTEATLTATPAYTWGYKLTVTSADGQKAVAKTGVHVLGDAVPAKFEDNYLADESYFNGDNADDVIYSGSYAFHINNMGHWWHGFAISNQTATTFTGYSGPDQYNSSVGHGYDNSKAYSVAYSDGSYVEITNSEDGADLTGVYVTNSACGATIMQNGNKYARAFAKGDWLKLTATGTKADGTTAKADFYLADYRDVDATKRYIITDWTWFDLSSLGKVKKVTFTFTGTDMSDNGKWLNTPTYFCLDDFNGTSPNVSGVDHVDNGNVMISVVDGRINVAGATRVAVYTLSGAQVSEGTTQVDVVGGVYIVVADGQAHKIIVK